MHDRIASTPTGPAARAGQPEGGAIGIQELDREAAALLPRRDTLCSIGCVDVTTIVGVNFALAVNAASTNVTANAVASQYLVALR